ncbi:MAG: DUF2130 domain-containing protein [Bacteroidia bacterium]|nr:DUF2130 domain-containing protein [Bacteroidia bacterium]
MSEVIKNEIDREKAELREKYTKEREKLLKAQEELEKSKENLKQQVQEELNKKNREWLEAQIRLIKEQADKDKETLQKLLEESKKKLNESKKLELDYMRLQQSMKEMQENFNLEIEKQKLILQNELEEKIKKKTEEEYLIKIKEMELKFESQNKLIDELKKKSEQGSMQLQGEAMEVALEEILKTAFPFDIIQEVPKGVRGADCIMVIRNTLGQECGKIVFESKRTKNFSREWIDKLKDDQRAIGADISILVTDVFPKEIEQFGFYHGIWICRFREVVPLTFALRDRIIRVFEALKSSENKGEKMTMLYNYLTGPEFRQQIEAITDGFMKLKQGIDKERALMEKQWKEREKQIEKIFLNTTHLYGSIKAIAGDAVGSVKYLDENEDPPLLPEI